MKSNAIVRIIIYSLLIFILIGILGGVLEDTLAFRNGRIQKDDAPVPTESAMEIKQLDFPAQIQNIEIDWVAGSIAIHPSDSLDHIVVCEFYNDSTIPEMICHQSGQTLKIEFTEDHEKFHLFGNNTSIRKDLTIRVPKSWMCNNLEMDVAASTVTVQNLTIMEVDFDGASGNLILDNCNVEELDIDTASGDVEFTGTLNSLDFDAASAKFYGEFYNCPRNLKLDSMSGDLEVVLPENAGFELKMEAMSSSFDTDFSVSKYDNAYVCGDGACKINVSAMSGDVNIRKGISAGKNSDH